MDDLAIFNTYGFFSAIRMCEFSITGVGKSFLVHSYLDITFKRHPSCEG